MATINEIADTLLDLRGEMARRLDDLENEKDINSHASASLFGILEGLASIEDAMRNCDGKPSVGTMRKVGIKPSSTLKERHG